MGIRTYLKRGIDYVLHGVPQRNVYPQVVYLGPSELLSKRVAFVTGGSSGIGYEIAKAFVKAGASCIITGRNIERLNVACSKISEETNTQSRVLGYVMDIRNVSEMRSKVQFIIDANPFGKEIDILVNNAGVMGGGLNDCTEDIYNNIMDTNVKATFFLCQFFGRYMRDNKINGNILNVGSSSSLRPSTSAYSISKNAIYGFTKGLAKLLTPYNITVNGIAPGPTATPMLIPNGINDNIALGNPLGRYILPGEVANVAVLLVSEMGRSVIGDMVFMTGGSGIITFDDAKEIF